MKKKRMLMIVLPTSAQELVLDVFDAFVESEDMWGTKIYVDQEKWIFLNYQ